MTVSCMPGAPWWFYLLLILALVLLGGFCIWVTND